MIAPLLRPAQRARPSVRRILSIDRGSSSLKIAVFENRRDADRPILDGGIERLDATKSVLRIRDLRGPAPRESDTTPGAGGPIAALLAALRDADVAIDGVGHRLVYGGPDHEAPVRVNDALLRTLDALVPFDPLHLPAALGAIREVQTILPDVPQVVCFDTAFHHGMPDVAHRLPLPRELWSAGVRRYGFHGLSYESIVHALGDTGARGAMIVAHLGSGASAAAIRDGRALDTTMGFSPLGGLMMGTRPGDLDPGAILYLLREGRYTAAQLEQLLTERSGLLGVSGRSADMQTLLGLRGTDAHAAEAVELFVYDAKKQIGALAAVLGGLDTFVFTGGIGEHSAPIRWEIAAGLEHLGIALDAARNAAGAPVISRGDAPVVVRVIPANENLMVAQHTVATLFAAPDPS